MNYNANEPLMGENCLLLFIYCLPIQGNPYSHDILVIWTEEESEKYYFLKILPVIGIFFQKLITNSRTDKGSSDFTDLEPLLS